MSKIIKYLTKHLKHIRYSRLQRLLLTPRVPFLLLKYSFSGRVLFHVFQFFFKAYSLQKQTKTSQAITVTCRQIITEYSGLEYRRPVFLNLVCQSLPDASVHRGCLVGNGEIRFAAGSAGTLARIVYTVAIVTEQRAFISVSSSYVAPPL